ncbi:hypothetical protein TBLA_0C06850 [Henningerozyma blattae CBS 6284]|uniref:Bromo domain-containing protein n=1 Tax=Henningerozyma blattae (strain ATCC 34711 / CBS 6284 / DSM 70876 / NBRC 10599 / NRRL Y-10934 / UCD 77-7) TaxID=1071380 RepID=I2H275_HENB6|nr:hypothetical protein TBLA_0C06850 [Tetrapisispora blattae CBS 6284]CCH60477.1 hypothetical protein TBLA_0C06850 [Tetrapisispora blattae CBS 6284]
MAAEADDKDMYEDNEAIANSEQNISSINSTNNNDDAYRGDGGNDDEDDEEDEITMSNKRSRLRSKRLSRSARIGDDEDESFHEDEKDEDDMYDEDDYTDEDEQLLANNPERERRRQDRNFVVQDQDSDDNYDYSTRRSSRRSTRISGRRSTRNSKRKSAQSNSTSPPPLRNLRSRTVRYDTSNNANNGYIESDNGNGEVLSLQEELRDLRSDDPPQTEKRFLRERTKHIDYTLPPPLPDPSSTNYNSTILNTSFRNTAARNSPKKRPLGNTGPLRRLFPTGGPFGGNDVITVFGKNTNFYYQNSNGVFNSLLKENEKSTTDSFDQNINASLQSNSLTSQQPSSAAGAGAGAGAITSANISIFNQPTLATPTNIPGQITNNNNNNTNKRMFDSDSSDDEILPFGTKSTKNSNTSSLNKKKKKKPEIADLDPLGVDMNINFDDVGGLDNYIDQLKEMVSLPLLYPELYQNFNISPPRGVLFHGPPGTGKTLMARALAASCSSDDRKITFFMRKGADILSKWVGEAERQLRLLFEEAKKNQPSIIFFDEIDGLAPVRSSKQEQIHASIVSTLLALMDGMDNRGQVIVIGATNRPDAVDPALRRPGRFDREFYFPLPDLEAREKIIGIHTKKWNPPLSSEFRKTLARLTKGFGGADLRALCTDAVLISIQRQYPQIYRSNKKLKIDPTSVKININDFMIALEKLIPSSARSTGDITQPLPQSIEPLLDKQFGEIKLIIDKILPQDLIKAKNLNSNSLIQQFIDYEEYVDSDDDDLINGNNFKDKKVLDENDKVFIKHKLLKRISDSRIFKPNLLIIGPPGNGQQYIGSAILNHLEHFNTQTLDIASVLSDSLKTMEAVVTQCFVEARKRQPSAIFIPNIDIWCNSVSINVIMTLVSLFRSLQSNEKILLIGIAEGNNYYDDHNNILADTNDSDNDKFSSITRKISKKQNILQMFQDPEVANKLALLDFGTNISFVHRPELSQRKKFFESLSDILTMKPTQFNERIKRRKPLPNLPLASDDDIDALNGTSSSLTKDEKIRSYLKSYQHQDMKLKNVLKIKLSGLMDLFKNRYKRFRKPPIDDALLIHLFEPEIYANTDIQPEYVKDGNMILEVSTGRKFFNMDLDVIEERLWNGFYSEPRQFLKDIEMIYYDANVIGERERTIKASEMFANAQMGIEDISIPEFIKECKATNKRDLLRQEMFLKDEQIRLANEQDTTKDLVAAEAKDLSSSNDFLPGNESIVPHVEAPATAELEVGAGNQLQTQLQIVGDENIRATAGLDTTLQTSELDPVETKEMHIPADDNNENALSQEAPVSNKATAISSILNETSSPRGSFTDKSIQSTSEETPISNKQDTDILNEEEVVEKVEKDLHVYILDEQKMNKIIGEIIKQTKGFTVSELESLYSELVEIVWNDRLNWDKTETLEKLLEYI